MSSLFSGRDEGVLKKIATKYSSEGYEVVIAPSREQLPQALKDFGVDMIAKRGNETVVIQVKGSIPEKVDSRLPALAEIVSRIPNWRLDFVGLPVAPMASTFESLTYDELRGRVAEAQRLRELRSVEASVMLLWSATEGTLRLLARKARVSGRAQNPSVLIKNLYSGGVISEDQYSVLNEAVRYRNATTHAYRIQPIREGFLQHWSRLVLDLLGRLPSSGRN